MSASKRDRTKLRPEFSTKGSTLRRDDHDMYIACNPVSVPALPPLKYMLSASTGESLPGHTPNKPLASKPADLSVVQLPQLVAKVGPELATGQFTWMEGPCLTAAALGTDIPFKVIKHPQEIGSSPADKNVPKEKCTELDGTKTGKVKRAKSGPLTGTEVFHLFAKKRHLGKLQFYHLKACEDGPFRPYELCVVPPSKAGPDHYIFSPTSVTHIQDGQSVGVWSLAGWYQEAVLWKALRDIPFFRSYLLRKGFMRWRRNIRRIAFRRRRDLLHTHMLIAVPQISHALLHFNRLLEELSRVCWIPQDESRTFTLLEFQTRLSKVSQESRGFLERFLHYRSLILTTVRDFSHSAYQELHQQVELSAQGQRGLPLHTQQASTRRLRQQLEQTGRVQHKLGRFAALVDHMIVQGLVTISRREITAFHTRVLKREQGAVGSVFQAELIFGEDSQLTVFPPLHLFQEALRGTLCSVHDSVLQVVDSCNDSLDSKESVFVSFQDITSSTGLVYNTSVPLGGEFDKTEPFLTSDGRISSLKKPCVVSTSTLVLPKRISLQVQGKRLHMQYCALSRTQLEWHLQLHAGTQEVEKEQARITQEAFQEIHQLCESHSWLVDTYFFISQWRPASLESMRGWSALQYEEHVQKVQLWIERVRSMPPAFTTSNKLLTVNLSHIREKLEPMLNTIEEDALRFLSEELQLHSENLKSELKKVIESLKSEPTDFNGQTNYIGMVKFYKEKSVDMQAQLKFICSLQEIVQLNCRSSTPGKQPLVEQTHDLWNHFVPLLERAEEMVTRQLPSVVNMLDSTFSSLTEQVRELVSKATAGPTVGLMSTTLTGMCKQLHDLSRTSKSLRGHPLDLTFVTRAKQTVEAQMGLWELLTMSSAQIREWKLLLFSKFVVSRSQEKVTKWLEQAAILAKVITSHNAVLQETLHTLESFNQQLSVLAKLSNPTVKHKHWTNIFKGMGLLYVPDQNLTVADLMTKGLWEHRDNITKICSDAQAEADMQWELHRLQRCWEGSTFRLAKLIFTLWHDNSPALGEAPRKKPDADLVSNQHSWDSGTFTIIGLDTLRCQTEDSVMTLSCMRVSPHAAEFRQEAEHWVQIMQELQELLDLFERYQKKWVFLSKIFHETFVSTQNVDLLEKFSPVDKTFREMIHVTLSDPHVLNFVRGHKARETNCHFHGKNLRLLFIEGLKVMEDISSQLLHLLDSLRGEFPRLRFLSDGEVIKLLSLNLTPSSLLPLVRKCFRGVRWLEVGNSGSHDLTDLMSELELSNTQMSVKGVYGSLMEHVPFTCSVEPHYIPVVWLGHLETKLHQTIKQLILKCTVARHCPEPVENELKQDTRFGCVPSHEDKDKRQSPSVLQLISEYPLQCLFVAEEVLWCSEIQKVVLNPAPTMWVQIKAHNAAKLQTLCQTIRDTISNSYDMSLASRRTVTALRALVLLTIKHSQQVTVLAEVKGGLESAFEWKRIMKYRNSAIDKSGQSSLPLSLEDPSWTEHSVHVDVLGTKLTYGYEYIGPENWVFVNTPSADRACLGILLALNSYRCAFMTGSLMSGKENTVLQLGWGLGRQVITLGCCANTSPLLICQMLLGALQTGAWLVLDSVDSMEQGTLSVLGQHLTDIHQCLSIFQEEAQLKLQEPNGHREKLSPQEFDRDPIYTVKKMLFGGRNIWAKLSYGCVIISSNGYSAEVPDNLRTAARSVSLMQPDYSVITEVLLVSMGFSQAASMSRRLISLFSLAKDSFCLPDFVSGAQSSWLILLQKVIYASGTCLYRGSDDNGQNGQKPDCIPIKASEQLPQEMKDHCSSLDKYTSNCSIVHSVREDQAVIRGIMLILLPAITKHSRALQFRTIFEEIFPIARSLPVLQTFMETSEKNLLRDAITEELQKIGCCADTQLLHNTVTLHQALRFSNAVVLVGPPGSGKTTLYQALAGALRRLAAKSADAAFEEGFADPKLLSTSCWCSVDTVVLFPNALSDEELFGGCHEQPGSWRDGSFTKVLRDTEQHDFSVSALSKMKKNVEIQRVKWLVLDGEPLTQSRWFDCLGTLGDPKNPFVSLSSGENIHPSQEVLKFLIESTSLADANPSALTWCSLVYVSGKYLWKAAWKAEMNSLYREHTLDQRTLKMWSCLAEDLFSSTLNFLRHNELNTVMPMDGHGASRSSLKITDGLQEITSFIKILHALLAESGKGCVLKCASKHTTERGTSIKPSLQDPGLMSASTEVQARNLFVVAYIWSFGGHLHPRHWPQFDLLARKALLESRYKIEVPTQGTVFEHFFNFADTMLEDSTRVVDFTRNKGPKHSYTSVPQYGKCAYLMDLMLEAHQSVLLVGETGSGKTKLGKSLLSPPKIHVHLPVSPLLHPADLRSLLESIGRRKARLDFLGAIMQYPGLVLFLDDLHEAPFDIYGKTSMTLEILRQCISRGGVPTSDGCHFKMFCSGAISYLSTCSTLGPNSSKFNQISPRLSRLFTVLALPSMTLEILFSIHSTQLQQWLKNFPSMPRITDLTHRIVTATFGVYLAVRKVFRFSTHTSQFVFSLHDLKKVFQGMCLWDPKMQSRQLLQRNFSLTSSALPVFAPTSLGPAANVLTIARLWMHECFRTFGDRLSSDEECQKLVSILTQMSEENFGSSIVTECQTREDLSSPACQSKSRKADHISQSLHLKPVPQDMEESTISRKESVESPIAEGIESHSKQVEKSEWCSEEENSSDYSVSSSETEEDCYSSASSNRRKQEESDYDSASSTVTGNPQIPPSSPRDTKLWRSSTKVNQSMASQQVLNQSDVPTCKKPQDSSKMFLQLLLDSGSSIRNVVFSSDICGPSKTIAEHQFRCQFAYLERDMAVLVQQLAHIVANREEGDNCNSAPYAVYHQRVCQLTHVLRALLVPGGHGVLFRAAKKTGRKSTVRLAAYLTGYRIIEVHHRNEGKLKEMWKEAERHICLCGGHVVFLIHEDTSQAVRDELLVVMDTGTFPRHYTDEKLKVPNSGTLVNNTQCHLKYDQVLEKCFTNAQRNIHVFLLVPINRVAYERQAGQLASAVAHITKAVTLCCCVEVYQPWSSDTLVEIASRQIQITNIDIKVDATLVGSITQAMAGIHTSATAYASSLLNIHPFSPQTFIELIAYFCYLYDHLGEEGRGNTNRVATVVTRVKEMIATAQTYSKEVLRLEDQYENTQKTLKQLQRSLTEEHRHCEQTRQYCLQEESQLSHLEEHLEQGGHQVQGAFREVSPLYQAALKAIQSLSQSDLDEVRHYRRPPHGVVILMDSICMLFDRPCNWESCKQLLGKPGFLQELEFFDRSKVSDEMLQKLSEIVQSPNFQRCAVHSVSRACESLCCWVRAVYQYASVQRLVAPQKALKRRLARSMAESRARLREDRLQEEEARKRLEEMEEQREVIQNHLEELEAQVHKVKGQEEEATAAIQQVRFFTEKWSAALKETERNSQTLSGDALIVAAAVAYLGPFQPHIRLELLEKWQALCLTGQINLSPEDPRTSLFGGAQSSTDSLFEPIPVDPDLQRALARAVGLDHCAVQGVNPYLVLKLLLMGHSTPWAHCWALLTHTQQYEELSSHTLLLKGLFPGEDGCSHKEDDYELVLSADDPELLDKLRHGAKTGLRVLVTHIEQAVPTKELVSMLARPAGSHFLEKVRPTAACHPAFRLVLSTPLPVHALLDEIHPLILEKVKVIDLSLSTSQVRDVILSDLLQSECSGLWVQHCQATRDKHTLQEKLQIEEASLMQYILKSVTPLLQDPGFLPQVSVCQNSSLLLQAQLEGLAAERDRHRPLLSSFHQRAAVATALYKALEEVQRLSPFYNFRLRDFLIALRQTLVLKGRPNVRSSRGAEGAETSVVVSEITHRVVSHLLAQYRPCLFQQHAELLRLLMSVSLMHEGCTEAERVTFLKGFSGIKFPQCASPPTECSDAELPNWISPHVHAEVCLLDRTSPFRGLVSSLRNSSRQWQEYLHFPSSTVVGPVPCQSHSHLTMLQRAILWKTLFPEWLAGVADDLAACQHGRTADGPHIGCSLNLLSSVLSRNKGPIIVHLPGQSTDRLGCVHPLHWIKQAAQYQADRKGQVKVTVLSFGSECQRDAVLSALDTAVQSGHWLVLNNCHLLDHWDAEVITQLKHLLSCTTRGHLAGLGADQGLVPDRDAADNRVHPDFRLWFITKGRNPLSVPAIVRIHALFLACDSHWDLKSELCCSLRQVLATARLAACPRRGTSTTEPLLRCAVLHSVLLQRQKLKSLGQGKMYNWSQEDLHSLAEAHLHIARHCTDPTGALEYIAASLTHGGHVSDSGDLEAVKAVCRLSLQPPAPLWGSGPHTLAETLNMTAHSDAYLYEEDVLRGLEHCVLTTLNTLNITEAQALGFSEGMSSAMQKEKGRTLCVLLLKSQSTRRHADDLNHAEELSDYRRTLGRLWALREQMGGQAESHAVAEGTAWLGPLPAFLQTEWNLLRETLSSVLEGVSQPSQDLSASPYTISELEIRADLLRMYRQQGSNSSPQTYCLSAFTNPRGFLASLIRETICNKHRDASHVSLHFQVLEAAAVPSSVSSDGIYLCGLELHGALWDTRLRALHATLSPNPCALPLLWVRALVRDEHLSSPDNLHTSSSSMQLYNCPLYVHSQNKDGGWSLSEENIVTHIPLKTKLDPALCTLRRVRLVSTLKEKELSC